MVRKTRTVMLQSDHPAEITVENDPEYGLVINVKDSKGSECRIYPDDDEFDDIRDFFLEARRQKISDDKEVATPEKEA